MPPTALISSLESLRTKVKLLSVGFGAGVILAAFVVLVLAVIGLDYTLNLPAIPRVMIMFAAVGTLAFAIWKYLIVPAVARFGLRDVASHVERVFPQFDDRLRSTVDFVGGQITGSATMQQRVIDETSKIAGSVNLSQALQTRPVVYSLGGGVGAMLLFLILATVAVGPQFRAIAASRLFTPFSAMPWPKSTQIEMTSNIPTRLPVGEKLDLRMRLAKGDKSSAKAIVEYQYGGLNSAGEFVGGPVQQEYMMRGEDGTFAVSLDARAESNAASGAMRIKIRSGDDSIQLKDIVVLPRMAVQSATAVVTLPKYVGAENAVTSFDLSKAPAQMPFGSRVQLQLQFNKPLALSEGSLKFEPVESSMKLPESQNQKLDDSLAGVDWQMTDSLRFRVFATDTDGFTSSGLEEYELLVKPDQMPAVQIENPRRSEDRTAVAVIPLQAAVEDDYGVRSVKLIVYRLSDKKHWEFPLLTEAGPQAAAGWLRTDASGDRMRYRLNWNWDLAQLSEANLQPGDVLEYHLAAEDNFDLDGRRHEPVSSGRLRITIISQEDLTARVVDELRQVKERINDVRLTQDRTLTETREIAGDTHSKDQLDQADQTALERLSNQQSTAASSSRQLAGKLEQIQSKLDENKSPAQDLKDLSRDVKDDLNRAAEDPMKQASGQLAAAKDAPQPDQRNNQLDQAQENQSRASAQLQRAMDRMENIGTLRQAIDRVAALLKEQQDVSKQTQEAGRNNLGKKPEEMNPEDRKKLDDAANAQKALQEKTDKELANLQKTAEQLSKADPNASEAMKQAAQTAQQQQVSQNQSKASQAAGQNKQAEAQSAQKQAELGLQVMLNQLREAERRKLAELQKQLAELEAQVANLVRRQATHNLDNVTLQGPERLGKLDEKAFKQLLALAQRAEDAKVELDLQKLSAAQELTERNSRDIARKAEGTQGAGEVANQLVKAAGKMERAIVFLRQQKLPDAYEPPQVDALAALTEAFEKVAQMKREADEKADQEKKEAIRQAYITIRGDQEKLNGDTTNLEQSRQPDGSLKRPDAIRLGQLPGEQQTLADRMKKLDEAVSALGSVVYTWANKDIIDGMGDVKRALGKQETGDGTQGEQKRIVDQLQAMIDNLAEKPIESKFAQDAGGGGGGAGGGSQAQLPTEAELRLVRSFQEALNKATIAADAQPEKDRQLLLDLGTRQGQYRELLGQLLEQSSRGQIKFGKEPDNRDQLPEEANEEDLENKETDDALLQDKPDVDPGARQASLVGTRMARSRQRLAMNNDPGKVTQLIQKKIQEDLDFLIEQARKQQAQSRNADPSQAQGQQQQNQPAQANGQQQQPPQPGGQDPAQQSNANAGPSKDGAGSGKDIREDAAEWGKLPPRVRAAVLDSKDETIIESYRKLVEDYYKSLATKAGERQ